MALSRLLVPVLLILSASAFAQKQTDSLPGPQHAGDLSNSGNPATSEPWKIAVDRPDAKATNPLDRLQIDQFKLDRNAAPFKMESRLDPIVVTPESLAGDGSLCYTIRSYVVARDSKDSDSVHPVGYSTCQPASRYRLKTAEMHASGR